MEASSSFVHKFDGDLGVPYGGEEGSCKCSLCEGDICGTAGMCRDRRGILAPICWACRTLARHKVFGKVTQLCKEEFKTAVKPLQNWVDSANDVKKTCDQAARHNRSQVWQTERRIKDEFEKLHLFLREEEEARIAAVREEEEHKGWRIKETVRKMKMNTSSLSTTVKAMEKELTSDDVSFLQGYQTTMARAWGAPENPEKVPGTLIDVAKHLSNLKFRVWEKMLETVQYTPVTLNPNTGEPFLVVSADLTSVRDSDVDQPLPNNPERFSSCAEILGSQGWGSGRHCWDVEVGNNTNWIVGVARETVQRKAVVSACPENGVWGVCLRGGEYKALESPSVLLQVQAGLRRVRVQLDWDGGEVTFSDPTDGTPLYTFTHPFTERVYPYFCTSCQLHPLRIIPEQVFVSADLPN